MPAALQDHVGADDRQRQQHQLHPARDEHRLDARGGAGSARQAAAPGASSPTSLERVRSLLRPSMPRHLRPLAVPRITAILFIGDVVARAGRRAVRELLPGLREELGADFVVVNGENAAGGLGITPKEADEMLPRSAST